MKDVSLGSAPDSLGQSVDFYYRQFPAPFPPLIIALFVREGMLYHAIEVAVVGDFEKTLFILGEDLDGTTLEIEIPIYSTEVGYGFQTYISIVCAAGKRVLDIAPKMLIYCPISEQGVFRQIENLSHSGIATLKQDIIRVGLTSLCSFDLGEVRSDYIWLEHIYEQLKSIIEQDPMRADMNEIMGMVAEIRPRLKARHNELKTEEWL